MHYARQGFKTYFGQIIEIIHNLLEDLKTRDLSTEKKPEPAPVQETKSSTRDIAEAIHGKMAELGFADEEEAVEEEVAPVEEDRTSPTVKFDNLQFGRNYDPHGK